MAEQFDVTESDRARFWSRVNKNADGGCWVWTALKYKHGGYGQFYCAGKHRRAHRVSLVMHGIALVDGLQCDHLCRVRTCVNPSHIEQVKQCVNIARGASMSSRNSAKAHCPKCGGAYVFRGNGSRYCRRCANDSVRMSRQSCLSDPNRRKMLEDRNDRRRAAKRAIRLAESLAARVFGEGRA